MTQKALTQPAVQPAAALARRDLALGLLSVASALLVLGGIALVFFYAPEERTMGMVQKIFYFHVPSAWAGFLAFGVTFVASVIYLARRDDRADQVAVASSEVGLMFLTMAIITGSIWARPVWNTWWTWDARLTSATICWLAYLAYFMLRGSLDDPERAKRLAAVYACVAIVTVPMTFLSIYVLRTIHPNLFGTGADAKGNAPLTPAMGMVFGYDMFAFTVFYGTLLWHRVRLESLRRRLEALRARVTVLG